MKQKLFIIIILLLQIVRISAQDTIAVSRIDFEYNVNGSLSKMTSICDSIDLQYRKKTKELIKSENLLCANLEIIKKQENYRLLIHNNNLPSDKKCMLIVSSISGINYYHMVDNLDNMNVDLNSLPKGNYIITLIVDGKSESIKLTKTKEP